MPVTRPTVGFFASTKACWLTVLAATLPALAAVGGEASAAPSQPEETLELPPFQVPGQFSAEGWTYARMQHTEFVSQLSENRTRELLADFVVFQDFVRAHHPEAAPRADSPTTVVLCASSESYQFFGGDLAKRSTVFPNSNRFIVINDGMLDARTDDAQATMLLRRRWLGFAHHEGPSSPSPLWLEWGTRELLIALHIAQDRLEFGYPPAAAHSPGSKIMAQPALGGGVFSPLHSQQFQLNPDLLLPLHKVFSLTRSSAELDPVAFALSRQATAFMHMCLFSLRHRQFREPYRTFVARLETEPYSEALFLNCFQKSTADVGWILHDYLFGASMKYESLRYKIPPAAPILLRPAAPTEVLRLLRACQDLRLAPPDAVGKSR